MPIGTHAANLRRRAQAAAQLSKATAARGLQKAAQSRGANALFWVRAALAYHAPFSTLVLLRIFFFMFVAVETWLHAATLCKADCLDSEVTWDCQLRRMLPKVGEAVGLEGPQILLVSAVAVCIVAVRAALNCSTWLETTLILPALYALAHIDSFYEYLLPLLLLICVGALEWRYLVPAEEKDDKTIVVLTALYLKFSRRQRLGLQACECKALKLAYLCLVICGLSTLPWMERPSWTVLALQLDHQRWRTMQGILLCLELLLLALLLRPSLVNRWRRFASGIAVVVHLILDGRWSAAYAAILFVPLLPSWAIVLMRLPTLVMYFSTFPGMEGTGSVSSSACSTPRSRSGTQTPLEQSIHSRAAQGGLNEVQSPELPTSPLLSGNGLWSPVANDERTPRGSTSALYRQSPLQRTGMLAAPRPILTYCMQGLAALAALGYGGFFTLSLPFSGAYHAAWLTAGCTAICLLHRRSPGYYVTLLCHVLSILCTVHLHLMTQVLYDFHECFAHQLRAVGEHREALAYYQQAIQINPDAVEGRLRLASLYSGLDRDEEARFQYEIVLKYLQPNNMKALLFLLDYYSTAGMTAQGCTLLAQTIQVLRNDAHSPSLGYRLQYLNSAMQCGLLVPSAGLQVDDAGNMDAAWPPHQT